MNKADRVLKKEIWNIVNKLHYVPEIDYDISEVDYIDPVESMCVRCAFLLKNRMCSRERKAVLRKMYSIWHICGYKWNRQYMTRAFFNILFANRNALSAKQKEVIMKYHTDILKRMAEKVMSNSFYKPCGSKVFYVDNVYSLLNPMASNVREYSGNGAELTNS